eukprot:TRINITY_DN1047_c0_g1_i1.p1 TRINITY_DN1047_c0_g1~~TRINITY_DN1047_c0_g1_i1.p1  ORF type:complete len:574 (+),score=118.68 TRINITY_DN1047_c0_g1_i1:248-1969(+)
MALMQWSDTQLCSLENILRAPLLPGEGNLVSISICAVGASSPSCTLTLSRDGKSCSVQSKTCLIKLCHCMGYLVDENTHRVLIICADVNEDLVSCLIVDGLRGSVELSTAADSVSVLSQFTSPQPAVTTALQKNLSEAAYQLAEAKAYATGGLNQTTPMEAASSPPNSLLLRGSEESLNELMSTLTSGSAKVSSSVQRYREHVQNVKELDLERDLSSMLNTPLQSKSKQLTQQDVLVASGDSFRINYEGAPEEVQVADCDWMSLVSTAVDDKLPWLEKMVHDHVLEVSLNLAHPLGARIRGFADSQRAAISQARGAGDSSSVVETLLSFCTAMRNVAYLGFGVLEEIQDDKVEAQVYSAIEKATLQQLDVDIFGMFCSNHQKEDAAWASCVAQMRSASPADHGVNPKYVFDAKSVFPNLLSDACSDAGSRAGVYQPAVETLRELPQKVSVIEKVLCISNTCDAIFNAIEDHYGSGTCGVGADDLLPLLSYVMIQAAPAQMESQLQYIEQFLPESLGRGQLAYFAVCARVVKGSIVDAASHAGNNNPVESEPNNSRPQPESDSRASMNLDEWWK